MTAMVKAEQGRLEALKPAAAVKTVRDALDKMKPEIMAALSKAMDVDKFLRIVMTQIQRNPQLAQCEQKSVLGSIMQGAQLGLDFDPMLGHLYLVPRKNKQTGLMECTCQIGYRGMFHLAMRSGLVAGVVTSAVYEKDDFHVERGIEKDVLTHTEWRGADRGPLIAAYAVLRMKDGTARADWMWKDQIDSIRTRSKATYGPWFTDEAEMAKKTVLRRLLKTAPISTEDARMIERAVAREEAGDAGNDDTDLSPPAGDHLQIEAPKTGLAALSESLPSAEGELA